MRFQVLGETQLVTNGIAGRIASERQRRLLAALVMGSPNIVPVDRLVEAVWGDEQPDNARSALRTVATRLRHSMDAAVDGVGQQVISRPPGYVLDVQREAVDANAFADLATVGRRRLAAGDAHGARAALGDALKLWTGGPYQEFRDEPWAQPEATRLERLWISAHEAHLEAQLALGLHADALGGAEQLIALEPYSDQPRALLMSALFATGRQADAVRVFQDYRRLLADELGLVPGLEITELETRILNNDSTLLTEPSRPLRGYRLHEQLTTTERGVVYRATQPGLERDVAIEVLGQEQADDAAFVRTFESEGQALAQLGHANVVPVYDCWREPGAAYLVRKLLSGGTLAERDVRERLGPTGLARVRDQVRSALHIAHQAGLVHGPIEAADIQLDDHDTAYLANFHLGGADATVAEDDRTFAALFDGLVGPSFDETPPAPTRVGNPYRGLSVFRASDVDVFFGRDRLVDETLEMLRRQGAAVVVGASGSGKSSLVRAGVAPALASGELDGSAEWFVVTMVPGARPFAELEAAILRVAVHPTAGLIDHLSDLDQPLDRTIRRVLPDARANVVLVIDQFEELFTLCATEERDRFLEAIAAAHASRGRNGLLVLATLRADFFDQPLAHPAIAALVKRSTIAVDALTGDELRSAIVEPARAVGIGIEPALLARMVADASRRPGMLPMLQFVLTRLFDDRNANELTLDSYLALGGLAGAIGARAEELYEALDATHQTVCRRLFGRLVAIDEGTDTRRRAQVAELRAVEPRPAALDEVVSLFVDARLLSGDRDPSTRQPTVEVAHEALFREWPRLAEWIQQDHDTITELRRLATSTASWRSGGDVGELYRGARLIGALDLAERSADRLTPDELAFIGASRELSEAEQQVQQRTNRRLKGLLTATGLLLVVALLAGLSANNQQNRADARADDAQKQSDLAAVAAGEAIDSSAAADQARAVGEVERLTALASSTGAVSQEVGILAALEAHRRSPSADTLTALHFAMTSNPAYAGSIGHTLMGGDITVLADGERIVTHSLEAIQIWDVKNKRLEFNRPFPDVGEVGTHRSLHSAASADGDLLVANSPTATTVIRVSTSQAIARFAHDADPSISVALSPDGSLLAVGLASGTVEVWDVRHPGLAPTTRVGLSPVNSLRWHPDGARLALGAADGEVVLWSHGSGADVWTYPGTLASTLTSTVGWAPILLFSLDGSRLIVAGLTEEEVVVGGEFAPGQILEFSSADGRRLSASPGRLHNIRSLTWFDAQENAVVVSGGAGAHVDIVDIGSPSSLPRVEITNFGSSAAMPELGLIVTEAGIGLDMHSIDMSNQLVRHIPLPIERQGDPVFAAHLSPTGAELIVSGGRTHHTIDLVAREAVWEPFAAESDADLVYIAGANLEGTELLILATEGLAWFDLDGEQQTPWMAYPAEVTSGGEISFISMSADGERLVLTVANENILLGIGSDAIATTARVEPLGRPTTCCGGPSFSVDGELFVRRDGMGGADVFESATGEELPFEFDLQAQLFGPRGTWFAAVDERGTVTVHDQQTGERLGEPLVGNRGAITYLLPTQGGRRIVAIGADGIARVWDLDTYSQVGRPIVTGHPAFSGWSADGMFLAVPVLVDGAIGAIEVWNFDVETWPDLACELAGRNMTRAEWDEFGPRGVDRRKTCPQFDLP